VFLDIHFLILMHSILDLVMLHFGVTCVILLTVIEIYVLILHLTQPDFASRWDNADVVLALHDSSFPLAQHTGFEAAKRFGFDATLDVIDACFDSEDTFYKVYDLVETPLEGSSDVLVQ